MCANNITIEPRSAGMTRGGPDRAEHGQVTHDLDTRAMQKDWLAGMDSEQLKRTRSPRMETEAWEMVRYNYE